jgi:hypothetical protein
MIDLKNEAPSTLVVNNDLNKVSLPVADGGRELTYFDPYDDPDERVGSGGGRRIKFTLDYKWLDDNGAIIPADREFLVKDVRKESHKWVNRRLVEVRLVPHGELFPDITSLNNACPQSEWAINKFSGESEGPWQNYWVGELVDSTMTGYTWEARDKTVGARIVLTNLKLAVLRAKELAGNNPPLFPVVTLGDTFMQTSRGGRQRPDLRIVRFVELHGAPTAAFDKLAPKLESMNDSIAY